MKLKHVVQIFLLTTIGLLTTRLIQLFIMIEPETGFYYQQYESAGLIIGIAVFICSALLVIFSFQVKKLYANPPAKSTLACVISTITGLGFCYFSINIIIAEVFSAANTGWIWPLISALLALLAAVSFFYQANNYYKGRPIFPLLPAAAIVFTVYELTRSFMRYTSIANISENLFDVALLCTQLLFWSMHAKIFVGDERDKRKYIGPHYGIGFVASLISLLVTVPRYTIMIIGRSDILNDTTIPSPLHLTIALYILTYLFILHKDRKPEKESLPNERQSTRDSRRAPAVPKSVHQAIAENRPDPSISKQNQLENFLQEPRRDLSSASSPEDEFEQMLNKAYSGFLTNPRDDKSQQKSKSTPLSQFSSEQSLIEDIEQTLRMYGQDTNQNNSRNDRLDDDPMFQTIDLNSLDNLEDFNGRL